MKPCFAIIASYFVSESSFHWLRKSKTFYSKVNLSLLDFPAGSPFERTVNTIFYPTPHLALVSPPLLGGEFVPERWGLTVQSEGPPTSFIQAVACWHLWQSYLSCGTFVHRHLSPLYPLMKYLNSPSALCSQEPPTLLIIFVLIARQFRHLWAPLRGVGNFQITSCTTLELQEIRKRDAKVFSHIISCLLHLSHVDLWRCCLFRLHPEGRCSEVPPNHRESPWHPPRASFSSSESSLISNPPTQQKQALPSSWISPYSPKTQRTFSLSKILALALLPEVFKVVDSIQKLDWFWTHQLPEQWMTQWVESWGQQAKWRKEEHLLFSWSFISPQQNPWHQKSLGNGFTSLGSALFI